MYDFGNKRVAVTRLTLDRVSLQALGEWVV